MDFKKHSLKKRSLIHLSVIVANEDLTLMNECTTVFPTTRHLLCYWHIQSNIKARYIRDFPTNEAAEPNQ